MNFLHAFHLILTTLRQSSYFLSKRVIFVLTLALGCVHISAAENPFSKLASDLLGKDSADEKWNVAVGSFNYENTDLQSPFSSMLRDELEIALAQTHCKTPHHAGGDHPVENCETDNQQQPRLTLIKA